MSKIIFVDRDGAVRAPMAAELYKRYKSGDEEVISRGLLVAFNEPLNQKAEAIMVSDGVTLKDFTTTRLEDGDIDDDTIVFAIERQMKDAIIERYEKASISNVYSLSEFIGEELDVMDPYGGNLQSYGICYESLKNMIKKLAATRKELQ